MEKEIETGRRMVEDKKRKCGGGGSNLMLSSMLGKSLERHLVGDVLS